MTSTKKFEIDMTEGPVLSKVLRFAIPLAFANILQILFNVADLAVVGRFSGSQALAAVGANASLVALLVNFFIGIASGTDILVARHIGERDDEAVSRSVHTSIAFAAYAGVAMIGVGFLFARPILELMQTPSDTIDLATVYLRIYFIGMPVNLLYQFGSAILRAIGDTRRPLAYLAFSGVINVILNLIFVLGFGMSVDGVALATIASQAISALLVLRLLIKSTGSYRVIPERLRIDKNELRQLLKIGFPIGLQSSLFALSNVFFQSSINTFGSLAVAGCAAAGSTENFCYVTLNAFFQTAVSFTGQNYGARRYDRILRIYFCCLASAALVGLVMGRFIYANGEFFISIFDNNPEIVPYGLIRMSMVVSWAFLVPVMDIASAVLRAMGHSLATMINSLVCVCGLRVLHLATTFAANPTLRNLFICYPVSWCIAAVINISMLIYFYRRLVSASPQAAES